MKQSRSALVFFALAMSVIFYQVYINSEDISWNEAGIDWHGYADGMEKIRATGKPGLIVIYGDWCGYCKRYAKLFSEQPVEQAMKGIIAIKVDVDDPRGWARRNGLEGSGVPRTFALDRNGEFIRNPRRPSRNDYVNWIDDRDRLASFIRYVASQ